MASERRLGNSKLQAHQTGFGQKLKASLAILLVVVLSTVPVVSARGHLEGIGYREQELQVAKTSQFATEDAKGVQLASMAGGQHIFIKGVGFDKENPEAHTIAFYSLTDQK